MKLKCIVFLAYAVISNAQSQTAVISANPDLLYSTANDYGPWGAPEFLDLLLLTPNVITLEELEAPFQIEPLFEP